MRPIATDVACNVVCVPVCLCVCWAHVQAVQKRLKRSRCRLEGWFKWAEGTMY